jgi:hypothetical protein
MAAGREWLWSKKFFLAYAAQGMLVLLATFILFILGSLFLVPSPAMVIASGSAGTWLTVGYLAYIAMTLYLGVSAFIYYMLEGKVPAASKKRYDLFATLHFTLANVGIFVTCMLLMYAGYVGGAALLPASSGGGGLTPMQVHSQLLGSYPAPIAVFVGITMLGVACGFASYCTACRKR